ncbi:phosphoribosylformylglycinamidine synthase [Candidatus Peregrinibacteria bacterium CG11_big_fil_rev_8_21_14_0_20_41_10]|nr:MAG: phosphoribosylformylglycinamidine synthase [Candidatus Peregrinibacteria bacterium CG11_big_fil_rev_8_21_14_0_20_41_10]PIZ73766.1 MAG: phosphoribosylformylglycinamidine synthase [Candidatus Peregrinibacteria bacterium CG_4_10_14_0_2_um_filter_41_8]
MNISRIEIRPKNYLEDAGSKNALRRFCQISEAVKQVMAVKVLTVKKNYTKEQLVEFAEQAHNPITEMFSLVPTDVADFDFAMEIGLLPGVTDNVATTTRQLLEDLHKIDFADDEAVASSILYFVKGDLNNDDLRKLEYAIYNPLIERIEVLAKVDYEKNGGMKAIVPQVKLGQHAAVTMINLEIDDEALEALGKKGIKDADGSYRGPLALNLEELHAIRNYFKKEGRMPTDIELEAIAQTWSEHCKHKIFASPIDNVDGGLYKTYIKQATADIRRDKGADDFCVSVFKDNAGAIKFNDEYYITDKAETHNTPSALDPFGGSITGIVGVNRDALGFGLGAKPVFNRYGFCFADPRDDEPIYRDSALQDRMLPPERIIAGVIKGVEAGGNESGIPGPQGFVYYNERYKGKPLVFVGTVGLIPREVAGKPSTEKAAQNNDYIVMVGGRVGQDGIHGATFSSESLDEASPSTAVQIGDPITQKKFLDAILEVARDEGLYSSITDNGAGGLSCSVAEMAEESGGCTVDLEKVPLKYANLEPWKIWISESQERMTLALPADKWPRFKEVMDKYNVEATVIGQFNDSNRCQVKFKGEMIFDLDMEFLHNGVPLPTLHTTYTRPELEEPEMDDLKDTSQTLLWMLKRLNIASYADVSTKFDHEVQGLSVIKPLQGLGKVNGDATVHKPDYNSWTGVAASQGLNPLYSDLDTYHMAACAIDTAIRNAVAVGGNVDHMALMDNFCWCSSNDPERLGQLKAAVKACYDYAVDFGTPYISGKDSMFNDFRGFDADGEPLEISVPPTLLISSLSVLPDVRKTQTLEPKMADDLVYVMGLTKNELGGSEYYDMQGVIGANVPQVDAKQALKLYRSFYQAMRHELIASSVAVGLGGLGIAFAKMVIAGNLGLEIDLSKVPTEGVTRNDQLLFSESQSRFVVTINPAMQAEFENHFAGLNVELVGKVTAEPLLKLDNYVSLPVSDLADAYFSANKFY